MADIKKVRWRVRLKAPAERVYGFLATDAGREKFWAEKSTQVGDTIRLVFPNGVESDCTLLQAEPCRMLKLDYFGAPTTFSIDEGPGATILTVEALPLAIDFQEV